MTFHTHTPPAAPSPDAAPLHPCRERWTAPKRVAFLRALAATRSVSEAARAAGMSRQSAYRLRARLAGSPFDRAWELALRFSPAEG